MGNRNSEGPDTGSVDYDSIDFGDLGVDLAPHRESLGAFARMNLDARSVKPALRARDLVFARVPSGRFLIGVTGGDLSALEAAEKRRGCTDIEVIHEATSAEEAEAIRAEVERYFQRHFPGRILSGAHGAAAVGGGSSEGINPHRVYVARYAPAA